MKVFQRSNNEFSLVPRMAHVIQAKHFCFLPSSGLRSLIRIARHSRVEPRCGRFRHESFSVIRLAFANCRRCPSTCLDFLPLAPSSNRKSDFPRYGLPTTSVLWLYAATVVVDLLRLVDLSYPNTEVPQGFPRSSRLFAVGPLLDPRCAISAYQFSCQAAVSSHRTTIAAEHEPLNACV